MALLHTAEDLHARRASALSLLHLIDEELRKATVDDALDAGRMGPRPHTQDERQRRAITSKLITSLNSQNRWLSQKVRDAEREIQALNSLLSDSREKLAAAELELGELRQDTINAEQEVEELRMSTLASPRPDRRSSAGWRASE